jgi:hypothetical protein
VRAAGAPRLCLVYVIAAASISILYIVRDIFHVTAQDAAAAKSA